MKIPLNAPVVAAISAALGMGAGVVGGILARQPEINKLKKQVKSLQSQVDKLQATVRQQNEEIGALLVKLKSMKIYQVVKKHELRNEIREKLLLQYASNDYLQLILDCAKGEREMSKEDIDFYNAYNRLLAEKPLSDSKRTSMEAYVMERHGSDIDHLAECDSRPVFDEIRDFEKEQEKPQKKHGFPFFKRKGKSDNEDAPDPY